MRHWTCGEACGHFMLKPDDQACAGAQGLAVRGPACDNEQAAQVAVIALYNEHHPDNPFGVPSSSADAFRYCSLAAAHMPLTQNCEVTSRHAVLPYSGTVPSC